MKWDRLEVGKFLGSIGAALLVAGYLRYSIQSELQLMSKILLIAGGVLHRSDIFGFIDSAIIDRPIAFLILIIDLDEAPIPLNLIVIVVPEALHWSNNNGVDANNGREDANVLLLKIFWSHPEKRTCFIDRVPNR